MLSLPHVIIGATIATKVPDPTIALLLAVLSHFIVDVLPHWNPHLSEEIKLHGHFLKKTLLFIIVDGLLGLFTGLSIASFALPNVERFLIVALGAFCGVLPDLLEAPYFFLKWRHPLLVNFTKYHSKIQFNVSKIPGLIAQFIVMIFCLYLLFR